MTAGDPRTTDAEPVPTRRVNVRKGLVGAFGLLAEETEEVRVPADTAAMWDERYWRARP